MLGVTCASWVGKGGDQLGSTTSEGYKAIQLIRQGEGGTYGFQFRQVFSAVIKMFNFFCFL